MTRIQCEIGKGKTDTRVFQVVLDDSASDVVGDRPADEPDFTMIMTPATFESVVAGETTIDVGYMQGTVKVTGNVGRLLSVLPLLTTSEFAQRLTDAAADSGAG